MNRALRAFDLTMLGLVLIAVVCGVICCFRGADLKAGASSGFAYWFLVVTGYLPMLVVNCVRLAFRHPVPAAEMVHEVVILTSTVIVWMAGLWIAFRIAGKRDTKSQTLHIATRLAQIVLCWGVFQLGCAAFTAVERWFGVAVPFAYEPAGEEVMAEFLQYTMDAGVFGQHNRSASLTGLKRAGETTLPGRLGLLLRRLFPAAKTIEPRYTYLKKYPWLLPVAWLHRLVRTRGTLGSHVREAGDIFRADSGEADRLGRLMRAVGLAETGLK